jgi:hypothetical protein
MTRDELIELLKSCQSGDEEANHSRVDRALLEYINDSEITELFESMSKWYA